MSWNLIRLHILIKLCSRFCFEIWKLSCATACECVCLILNGASLFVVNALNGSLCIWNSLQLMLRSPVESSLFIHLLLFSLHVLVHSHNSHTIQNSHAASAMCRASPKDVCKRARAVFCLTSILEYWVSNWCRRCTFIRICVKRWRIAKLRCRCRRRGCCLFHLKPLRQIHIWLCDVRVAACFVWEDLSYCMFEMGVWKNRCFSSDSFAGIRARCAKCANQTHCTHTKWYRIPNVFPNYYYNSEQKCTRIHCIREGYFRANVMDRGECVMNSNGPTDSQMMMKKKKNHNWCVQSIWYFIWNVELFSVVTG